MIALYHHQLLKLENGSQSKEVESEEIILGRKFAEKIIGVVAQANIPPADH